MSAQAHLPVHTAPELCRWALLLSRCFTATKNVWLIRDWGRVRERLRAQAIFPVHTAPRLCVFLHIALRPQKLQGLLGTGGKWNRE